MAKKILITGGSGLLGLNWALARRESCEVTLGLHTRRVELAGVAACTLPLDSIDALASTMEEIRPDAVVHTAGMTSVEQCEADPAMARHANVVLAENVAAACARLDIALAHISTDHLFAGDEPLVDEVHPVAPLNVYGRTKAAAELGVLREHPRALVVRSNFYGWGPRYRRSFSDFIIDALRAGARVRLFRDVHYTPILIEPLADAVHQLLDLGASGIFHVVGDDRVSKHQFGMALAEVFGLDKRLIDAANLSDLRSTIRRPRDMSLSNRKARDLLGVKLGGVDDHLSLMRNQVAKISAETRFQ